MSTRRQIHANRANARASTGPRTSGGKAQSSQNALRHGLSVSVLDDPRWAPEVELLARKIVRASLGSDEDPDADAEAELIELAKPVAAAQIDLRRIRTHRRTLLERFCEIPRYGRHRTRRRELRDFRTARLIMRLKGEVPWIICDYVLELADGEVLHGVRKRIAIFQQLHAQLETFDRYERRALSRRDSAVHDYNEAEAAAIACSRAKSERDD